MRRTAEDGLRAALGQKRGQAAELDEIAGALFGMEKNVFAGRVMSSPSRFWKFGFGKADFGFEQSPFIFAPAVGKVSGEKQHAGKVKVGFGVVGAEGDGFAELGDGAGEIAEVAQGLAQVEMRLVKIRVQRQRLPIRPDRTIRFAEGVQGDAQVHQGLEIVRPQGDGGLKLGDGLVK